MIFSKTKHNHQQSLHVQLSQRTKANLTLNEI